MRTDQVTSRTVDLSNGWIATFTNRGEFRMGTEGWGMLLSSPTGDQIRFFEDHHIVANDHDGEGASSCLQVLCKGRYGYLKTCDDFAWVIDFKALKFAPHRVYIFHNRDGEHLSAYEQPAYKKAREYVRDGALLIYLTFPFYNEERFAVEWSEYLKIRKHQLEETYFS